MTFVSEHKDYLDFVNTLTTNQELEDTCQSNKRGTLYRSSDWVIYQVESLGLQTVTRVSHSSKEGA